jgi:pimeloyl-ACP methyl ester carboxylesterase
MRHSSRSVRDKGSRLIWRERMRAMRRRYTEWEIDTNGITTVVAEWGTGDRAMVLLHGVSGNHRMWTDLAPRLVDAGYHVYAPDFRGSGDSRVNDDQVGRELSSYIDDLVIWTRAFDLSRFVLAGHSFGGRVAAEFAARYPDRVERLILIEPAGPDALNTITAQRPELKAAEEQGLQGMQQRRTLQGSLLDLLHQMAEESPGRPVNRARVEEILTNLEIAQDGTARYIPFHETNLAQRWISRIHDQRPILGNITAPTIVLRAVDSSGPLKYAMPHYADLISNARLVDDIPGDHALPTNNPDVVYDALVGNL